MNRNSIVFMNVVVGCALSLVLEGFALVVGFALALLCVSIYWI